MIDTRLFAFAALALSLAACTNDNEVTDNGPVAARINAEISDAVATRASGTTWNENDRIGLTGIGTQYDNVPYIMNGGTFKEDGEPIYFHTTEEVVFRAYYPYDENGKTLKATTDGEAQDRLPLCHRSHSQHAQSYGELHRRHQGRRQGLFFPPLHEPDYPHLRGRRWRKLLCYSA